MDRYQGVPILTNKDGKKVYTTVKYPDVPLSENDIYVIADFTDRLDLIANDYFTDSTLYWIIQIANSIPRDSLYVPAGTQLRIPSDITGIIQDYNALNGIS